MDNNINVTKYVANKIRAFREKKNVTQQELAEYLNTTQQSIARYENGDRKADQNILFALSDYFNVKIDDFFPKKNNNKIEEYELLFDTHKNILTDDDKEYIKFIIEKRIKEIDRSSTDEQ